MSSKKVLVCLSGGIDSSLAALLLKEDGYQVIGVTFRTWDYISEGCWEKQKGCCSIDSIMEAKQFAEKNGMPHHILDLREHFKNTVIKEFVSEYLAGRTPNPCVRCNAETKWGEVINFADKHECDYIATGHYAQVRFENNRYILSKGLDETKDQSYFLWMLSQKNLSRTIFPLGKWKKTDIKKQAGQRGLEKLVEKRESQEICFIPENNYREFLKDQIPDIDSKIGSGNFISTDGKILGKHKGFPYYTVGQRKGLGIALGEPRFVVEIRSKSNEIVLGSYDELLSNELTISNINLIKYSQINENQKVQLKIRYKSEAIDATLFPKNKSVNIITNKSLFAVAPGQSAVLYENNDVVGGGIIL